MRKRDHLAAQWRYHAERLAHLGPATLAHMQVGYMLGALAYSDLLRKGMESMRQEVEDFLVTNPDAIRP